MLLAYKIQKTEKGLKVVNVRFVKSGMSHKGRHETFNKGCTVPYSDARKCLRVKYRMIA